ncbi:hypothetical protein APE_0824 [Aeropyrum pernix spindle-shaped virus 1]|uniref:Peptidase M48 domain-containing protein n=2 Tax=root TaxID=1 RepID=Q9YDU4_AERPE|nr:hypothetical protein APE_0824 [Aeropyrum pernix spindle-shaped virus 1] [Aeropyrum pernix K1]
MKHPKNLGRNRQLSERSVEDELIDLLLLALSNLDIKYTALAQELASRMGSRGIIIVALFKENEKLPAYELAFSIGLGGYGIVFIRRELADKLPEEVIKFIVAHEVAHIVKNHAIASYTTRQLTKISFDSLKDSIKNLNRTKKSEKPTANLLLIIISLALLAQTTKYEATTIKEQELEADTLAAKTTGCKPALIFAEILNHLKKQGINTSHETTLGAPALTLDERINNIKRICQ